MKFLLLLYIGTGACSGFTTLLEDILKPQHTYTRPDNLYGHTYMNVSVVLHSLEMNENRRAMTVTGELIQEWEDENLRFSRVKNVMSDAVGLYGSHGDSIKQHIWLPDIIPLRTLEYHPIADSDFLRVRSDGRLTWTKLFHATLPCDMDVTYYPFESYHCILMFYSLGYDAEEVRPQWAHEPAVYHEKTHVSLPCIIDEILTETNKFVTIQRDRYQLEAEIIMECYSGWTIKHTVIPFIVTVTMAYFVFYLSPRSVGVRLFVTLMAYVISMLVHETTYQDAPQSPYTMALEIFTGTCLGFIFVAALESVVVEFISRLPPKLATDRATNGFSAESTDGLLTQEQQSALWLDKGFRVLYPSCFVLFNIVFWIVLMTHVAQLN